MLRSSIVLLRRFPNRQSINPSTLLISSIRATTALRSLSINLTLQESKGPSRNDSQNKANSGEASGETGDQVGEDPKSAPAQINIYQSQSDIIEGSKINTFRKKKEIGMTDDESTATGRAKAKGKDFLSFAFIFGAVSAIGYTAWNFYQEWVAWNPEDHAYDIAKRVLHEHPQLENNVGVNYTLSMRDSKGGRQWGDEKVMASPIEFDEDLGLQIIVVMLYASTKGRKCQIRAYMVKQEGESDDKWFPMFIYGETDYDKNYYSRKVGLVDNRKDINETKDLDLVREKFWEGERLKDNAIAMLKNDDAAQQAKSKLSTPEPPPSSSVSALGGALGGLSTPTTGKNMITETPTSAPTSSTAEQSTDPEFKRVRPKW